MAVIDSYAFSNNDTSVFLNDTFTKVGQSFTGDGTSADEVDFELKKSGSPTGNAVSVIYAHTGTFGSNGTPTGSALATSDNFDVSTLTTSLATVTFTFSTAFTPVNGTKYFVTVEYTGTFLNSVDVGYDSSSPTHGGNYADFAFGAWAGISSWDVGFELRNTGGGTANPKGPLSHPLYGPLAGPVGV